MEYQLERFKLDMTDAGGLIETMLNDNCPLLTARNVPIKKKKI